jgi:hypothetical protein
MTSVVDFLERMGSEAQWRYASAKDIEAALVDAEIDAPMRTAILAKSAEEVQALLAQARVMCMNQTPSPAPTPHEVPQPQPGPGKEEEEQEDDETPGRSKPSQSPGGSPSPSPHSSP